VSTHDVPVTGSRIRRLPRKVVDRIAAGEVVERPASVVKELVENALDAGATRIDVETAQGGRDLIVVTDDGTGMGQEDLALAFASHATSKLSDVTDLDHVASFGFRGEALASIGAVADCRITSCEQGAGDGYTVSCEGGNPSAIQPAACAEGTRVEVRRLFRHVPARRKFLRTAATESSHIGSLLHRIAIAHPGVAISLTRDRKHIFRVSAEEDRRARIARFFGRQLFAALLPIEGKSAEGDGLRLSGYVATPAQARGTAAWMHVFLNGRPISDRGVSHAVRHAFEGLLTRGKHPVAFLFLSLPPDRVDVNVHPAKSEVRFQDGQAVHQLVRRAVRRALLATEIGREIVPDAARQGVSPGRAGGTIAHADGVREALTDYLARPPAPPAGRRPGAGFQAAPPARSQPHSPAPMRAMRFLQVHDSFLVHETEEGVAILDQHALHERILLEELSERVSSGTLTVQPLLVPAIVELPAGDVDALLAHADELSSIGVRVGRFGETEVAVHALPALLSGRDPERILRGIAERLQSGKGTGSRAGLLDGVLHSMACRAAVMAGDPLTEAQAAELLRRADLIENPHGCAHGRPTVLRIPLRELKRHFER